MSLNRRKRPDADGGLKWIFELFVFSLDQSENMMIPCAKGCLKTGGFRLPLKKYWENKQVGMYPKILSGGSA
jgi:hypothetical protein